MKTKLKVIKRKLKYKIIFIVIKEMVVCFNINFLLIFKISIKF